MTKKGLKATLQLIDGSTYEAEIATNGEMNSEQKFLAKLQNDGGLWVDDADAEDAKAFIPFHAILMVHFHSASEKKAAED